MEGFMLWLHNIFGDYSMHLVIQGIGCLELAFITVVVFHRFRLRESPKWRIPLAFGYYLACVMLSALMRMGLAGTSVFGQFAMYIVNYAYAYGLGWILFSCHHEERLLNLISAMAVSAIVGRAYSLILNACGVDDKTSISFLVDSPYEVQYLIYWSLHIVLYAAFLPVFHRKRNPIGSKKIRLATLIVSSISVLVMDVFLSLARVYDDYSSPIGYVNKGLCILLGVYVLLSRSYVYYRNDKYEEKLVIDEMMKEEQIQFENLRSSISIINAKLHDIRHQVEEFQDRITSEELSRFQEAVSSYDSLFDTGNRTLDIILYEKKMICLDRQIGFSSLADGKVVERFDNTSLYSLLSNAIGNAVEASLKLKEGEPFISVNIFSSSGIGYIEVSNRYEGNIEVDESGRPLTSKTKEEGKHGLGYRSMELTAKKYGGGLSYKTEDGIYFLTVFFPLS